jgi:hypothetical protein
MNKILTLIILLNLLSCGESNKDTRILELQEKAYSTSLYLSKYSEGCDRILYTQATAMSMGIDRSKLDSINDWYDQIKETYNSYLNLINELDAFHIKACSVRYPSYETYMDWGEPNDKVLKFKDFKSKYVVDDLNKKIKSKDLLKSFLSLGDHAISDFNHKINDLDESFLNCSKSELQQFLIEKEKWTIKSKRLNMKPSTIEVYLFQLYEIDGALVALLKAQTKLYTKFAECTLSMTTTYNI